MIHRFLPLAALIGLLWQPAQAESEFIVPEGFEVRTLEPTGGRVARPQGWFYREAHNETSFQWVLSKENPERGPYQTGVRIQMIFGLQQKADQSAADFAKAFLASKRESAKVLSECEEENQGLLIRTCLVTEEIIPSVSESDPFQIRYSVLWGAELDVVVFAIAGTPKIFWSENEPIFNEIENFQLIDLQRFVEE